MTHTKQEELALQVDVAEWSWLRPHLERGGVIVVAADLDVAAVGAAMAADDSAQVGAWIAAKKLGKPEAAQIAAWDALPSKTFRMLVVSPWVLAQETDDAVLN